MLPEDKKEILLKHIAHLKQRIEDGPTEGDQGSKDYHSDRHWMISGMEQLCYAEFALNGDVDLLRRNVRNAVQAALPTMKWRISMRGHPKSYPYDQGALGDYHFSGIFTMYAVMESKEAVIELCRETNYGRYEGSKKVNSHRSIVCRILRAYLLEDEVWLQEELEVLKTLRVEQDTLLFLSVPKARWYPWFFHLFYDDRDEFAECAIGVTKWYRERFQAFERKGFRPDTLVNYLLLLTLKIANCYRGYDIKIEEDFLPYELINC